MKPDYQQLTASLGPSGALAYARRDFAENSVYAWEMSDNGTMYFTDDKTEDWYSDIRAEFDPARYANGPTSKYSRTPAGRRFLKTLSRQSRYMRTPDWAEFAFTLGGPFNNIEDPMKSEGDDWLCRFRYGSLV